MKKLGVIVAVTAAIGAVVWFLVQSPTPERSVDACNLISTAEITNIYGHQADRIGSKAGECYWAITRTMLDGSDVLGLRVDAGNRLACGGQAMVPNVGEAACSQGSSMSAYGNGWTVTLQL